MAEGMHIEVAHKLRKHTSADRRKRRWEAIFNGWLQARAANNPQLEPGQVDLVGVQQPTQQVWCWRPGTILAG
jgi:hypothetical protein